MRMRKAFARALRKWADLIDPLTPPRVSRDEITVKFSCDTADFERDIRRVQDLIQTAVQAADGLTQRFAR